MDYIIGGCEQFDRRVDRQNNPVINRKLHWLFTFPRLFIGEHIGGQFNPVVGIFISPIPLVADCFERDRIGGRWRILAGQQLNRGNRDSDENEHRNKRPNNLNKRVVRCF